MDDGSRARLVQSPLARLLHAGQYKEILRATIDSPDGGHPADETPLVVGALAFSGRQDEALAIYRWWTKEHGDDATTAIASLFFLSVGECRTGRYKEAIACCRDAVRAYEVGNALQGFFVHQAIGLLRHFTGRIPSSVRHAARARELAAEARFPYGRMLAIDLLGHGLTAKGDVHAGIALLEQSAELAENLGLVENAGAPRIAAVVHRARFGVTENDARRSLADALVAVRPEDAYSRRMALSELATQHAFAGEGVLAAESIDAASRIALPDGDRRAKIRRLLAESIVLGLGQGPSASEAKQKSAEELLEPELDEALEAEIVWARAVTMGLAAFDRDPLLASRAYRLARRTGIGRARFLATASEERAAFAETTEDRLAFLLDAVARDREEAIHRVVSEQSWGFLPAAFGHAPGRRIHLLHDRAILVVEDRGNVVPLEMPGSVLVTLLHAIALGPVSKEDLVRSVWRMKVYRPERHDALVHTAASRLRNALGKWSAWITISELGYGLAEGVTIHDDRPERSERPEAIEPRSLDDSRARLKSEPPPGGRKKSGDDRRAALLELLGRGESLSTMEIANALRISEMTAFRMLAALTQEGAVERTGQGKRTRYRRLA